MFEIYAKWAIIFEILSGILISILIIGGGVYLASIWYGIFTNKEIKRVFKENGFKANPFNWLALTIYIYFCHKDLLNNNVTTKG